MVNYNFGIKKNIKTHLNISINKKLTGYVFNKKRLLGRGVANYYFGIKITLKLFLNTLINRKLTC